MLSRLRLFDKLPRLIIIACCARQRAARRPKIGPAIATASRIDVIDVSLV
jgi:hypothetical protein